MAPGARLQELTAKYMQNPRRYFVPLANEYRKANELDRAIALCREHLPSQPGHMSGHIVLARAYYEKGDIEAAREVFLTSVALDEENVIALRHLGDIARARNDAADARQWYARVLDADPKNEEIERLLRSLAPPDAADVSHPADSAPQQAERDIAPVADMVELPRSRDIEPDTSAPSPPEPAPTPGPLWAGSEVDTGLSALADPTPPGLRAITTPISAFTPAPSPELPPIPARTLDTFDLSTLDAAVQPEPLEPMATPSDGIRVDDGVGFMLDDLDQLAEPAADTAPLTLPPVDEADFSAGIETPTSSAGQIPPPADDPLLSRPGFGALASFASWRTAQDRETPPQAAARVTPSSASPTTPAAAPPPAAPVADDLDLFAASLSPDAAPTAPEFVTETMAALYEQQGFTQQALDVYRALLRRTPGDAALQSRIAALELALSAGSVDKALQEDADKALQFDDLDADVGSGHSGRSALEELYAASPPPVAEEEVDAAFGGGWSAEKDGAGDDWFAHPDTPDTAGDTTAGFDGIFGISTDAFGQPAVPASGRESGAEPVPARTGAAIATVFGTATIAAADEAAADMLLALAGQMVGRLPKDAPTLPVPDILELPSAVAGDEATGTSPAPLLSFDRFFSGSGAPPRQRIDTPVARSATPARPDAKPAPPPSLSPTFGGVPVIPPPPASVTPSSWASFDQFVPPVSVPAAAASVPMPPLPAPPSAPPPSAPSITAAAGVDPVPPAASPPPTFSRPLMPAVPVKPKVVPSTEPYAAFTGLPSELKPPPSLPTAARPTDAPVPPPGSAPDAAKPPASTPSDPDRVVPSEFHKWLEGLS